MGMEMARRAPEAVRRAHCVVPVPTSHRNFRRRGYNQAAVIAEALAGALEAPLLPCLERRRQENTQTALNPMQRQANVSGAFVMPGIHRDMVRGLRIVLVDDVITTGATLVAAAEALATGAPGTIVAYAFSRTVPMSLEIT